jgi:hypothetical protein
MMYEKVSLYIMKASDICTLNVGFNFSVYKQLVQQKNRFFLAALNYIQIKN